MADAQQDWQDRANGVKYACEFKVGDRVFVDERYRDVKGAATVTHVEACRNGTFDVHYELVEDANSVGVSYVTVPTNTHGDTIRHLEELPASKREAREHQAANGYGPAAEAKDTRTEAQQRKDRPLARGVLDYFPDALMAVAELSRVGNEQHNKGQPMHWAFDKSTDEPDCILRHLVDRGTLDKDGMLHSAKVAWRALALLQREIESADPELHARRQEARDRAAAGK